MRGLGGNGFQRRLFGGSPGLLFDGRPFPPRPLERWETVMLWIDPFAVTRLEIAGLPETPFGREKDAA